MAAIRILSQGGKWRYQHKEGVGASVVGLDKETLC